MAINRSKAKQQIEKPGKLKKKDEEKLMQVAGNMTFKDSDGKRRHVTQVPFDLLPKNIQKKIWKKFLAVEPGYESEDVLRQKGGKISKRKSGGKVGSGSSFVASLYK
tara:strand:+ start:112 stop:432 length:321 start_codon:yes stop_codon:yes gene_type:complete